MITARHLRTLEKEQRCSTPGQILLLSVAIGLTTPFAQAQPANDLFANRISISGTNCVVTASSVGANKEAGEPYHAGMTGGASVWWSWTAPSSGTVSISTAGSSFDTLLGIYTGSILSLLTEVASNDDEDYPTIYTSQVVFDVTAGQTYQIAVDGYGAEAGSVRVSLQLGPQIPPPPAPAWVLLDPYGHTVRSTDLAGKVIILDFWATWCGPCKVEIPDFVYLQNKYRADGLAIIGASVDSTSQIVISFLLTNSPTLNYEIVMATSALEQAYGGVSAIPTTYIIDRQNLIRKKFVGTQSRSTFEGQIVPLLYCNTQLTCHNNGSQMVFCWPESAHTFRLESASTPTGPIWSEWPNHPSVTNGTNTVQVPMTDSARFFRLHMSY